jgi:hypothetical protein
VGRCHQPWKQTVHDRRICMGDGIRRDRGNSPRRSPNSKHNLIHLTVRIMPKKEPRARVVFACSGCGSPFEANRSAAQGRENSSVENTTARLREQKVLRSHAAGPANPALARDPGCPAATCIKKSPAVVTARPVDENGCMIPEELAALLHHARKAHPFCDRVDRAVVRHAQRALAGIEAARQRRIGIRQQHSDKG